MSINAWNPNQYDRFREERSRPFWDLAALVQPRPGMRVLDLGCGAGALTAALHQALGAEATVGVDHAPGMIQAWPTDRPPGLSFVEADILRLSDAVEGPFDLIFSNAALQWVPDNHAVLAALRPLLAPGGQLALSVPANDDHVSHRSVAEVAAEAPFAEALGGWVRQSHALPIAQLALALHALGFAEQRVFTAVYLHLLADREALVQWTRGSLLTAYEARLGPLFPAFVAAYRERLFAAVPPGPVAYPFKRSFAWGRLA